MNAKMSKSDKILAYLSKTETKYEQIYLTLGKIYVEAMLRLNLASPKYGL